MVGQMESAIQGSALSLALLLALSLARIACSAWLNLRVCLCVRAHALVVKSLRVSVQKGFCTRRLLLCLMDSGWLE